MENSKSKPPGVVVTNSKSELSQEAERLMRRWYANLPPDMPVKAAEMAGTIIDNLTELVLAGTNLPPPNEVTQKVREFQFDGGGKYPSFAIVITGPDMSIVVNQKEWTFDGSDEKVGDAMFRELTDGLYKFVGRTPKEELVHEMASSLRMNLFRLIQEGRIKPKLT